MTQPLKRRKSDRGINGFWQRYKGVVAIMLIVLGFLGLTGRQESYLDTLRAGNIQGCEQNNRVKAAERQSLRREIAQTRNFDPAILFPNTDPAVIEELGRKSIAQDRRAIAVNRRVDCVARYPDPAALSL